MTVAKWDTVHVHRKDHVVVWISTPAGHQWGMVVDPSLDKKRLPAWPGQGGVKTGLSQISEFKP